MKGHAERAVRVVVSGLLLACGSALAQERPAPQPAARLPDPPPAQPEGPAMPEKAVNLQDFLAAYKRAGSPRVLIYSDLVGVSAGGNKTLNDAGTITRLGARLEDLFRDPEVQIVEPGAMSVLTEQQMDAIRRNDSFAAASTLGKAANADIVLYLRLVEQAGKNAPYTGTYVLADLRRGTSLGRYAWDMVPGGNGEFDAARMTEYARAIARRAIDQFAEAFPVGGAMGNMRRFTIRVLGNYEADDLAGYRDALNAATGVKPGSAILRAEDRTDGTGVATFEVAYSGDLIDLRRIAQRAAVDQMGMDAVPIDAREGAIGLRLTSLSLSTRERSLAGGARTHRNGAERDRLAAAYSKAGSPKVAVMFNKPAVEAESALPEDDKTADATAGKEVSVVVGERVNIGAGATGVYAEKALERELREKRAERRMDAALDLRVFEDKVAERLLQLGITPRDLSQTQADMVRKGELKDRPLSDRELAATLGKAAGADIVVSGVGRIVRSGGGASQRVTISLRAYSVASGDVLGAASVQKTLDADGSPSAQAIEDLTAQVTARMAAQMVDRWEASGGK